MKVLVDLVNILNVVRAFFLFSGWPHSAGAMGGAISGGGAGAVAGAGGGEGGGFCPKDSYCHLTEKFAKCCPIGESRK